MSKPVRSRRLMAVFAAYVVALQGLLLPLTVAAFATPETVLCVTAEKATHQPAGHDTGCACAAGCGMQGCAPSLAAPPGQAEIVLRAAHGVTVAPPLVTLFATLSSDGSPHSPRAPPAA